MKPGKILSKRVKELREAVGLSQQELANRAGLSVSQVAKLEQGSKADPRVSTLLVLAAALGVKPGGILDDLPLPPAKKKEKKKAKKEKVKKEKVKEKKEKVKKKARSRKKGEGPLIPVGPVSSNGAMPGDH